MKHYTSAVLTVGQGKKSNCVATTRTFTKAGLYEYRSHLAHGTWQAGPKDGKAKSFELPQTGRWIWRDCIVYQLDKRRDAKGRVFAARLFTRTELVHKASKKRITLFGPTWSTNTTGGRFEWGSSLRRIADVEV